MKYLGINSVKRLVTQIKAWVLKISFEVDSEGNLYMITPDE